MDKVYILVLLLMIIPILICIKYAGKVKSEVASSIVKCLVLVIITILSNGVFVLSDNQLFSYVMEGLYLFSFDVLLIYILQYSQQYTRVFSEVTSDRLFCCCRFGWNFTASKCVFSSCIYVESRKLYKFSDVSY
jgi:hypothetical protein